jgi:hypothetical protein
MLLLCCLLFFLFSHNGQTDCCCLGAACALDAGVRLFCSSAAPPPSIHGEWVCSRLRRGVKPDSQVAQHTHKKVAEARITIVPHVLG